MTNTEIEFYREISIECLYLERLEESKQYAHLALQKRPNDYSLQCIITNIYNIYIKFIYIGNYGYIIFLCGEIDESKKWVK